MTSVYQQFYTFFLTATVITSFWGTAVETGRDSYFLKKPPYIKALDAIEATPKGIICALKKGMTVVVSESGRILCIFFFI